MHTYPNIEFPIFTFKQILESRISFSLLVMVKTGDFQMNHRGFSTKLMKKETDVILTLILRLKRNF